MEDPLLSAANFQPLNSAKPGPRLAHASVPSDDNRDVRTAYRKGSLTPSFYSND